MYASETPLAPAAPERTGKQTDELWLKAGNVTLIVVRFSPLGPISEFVAAVLVYDMQPFNTILHTGKIV